MKELILRSKKFQFLIKFVTAMAFALFTLYQLVFAIQVRLFTPGMFTGIGFYLLLTVASILAFPDKYSVWVAHSVLFVAGLILLFAFRMISLTTVFEKMSFSNVPSVLNFVSYIILQIATLVLMAAYVVLRADMEKDSMRTLETVLMTAAISLYVINFIIECVIMIGYHVNVDLRLSYTVISRFLLCLGYVGTAISFILPAPKKKKKKRRPGEFYYSDDDEDEIEFVV